MAINIVRYEQHNQPHWGVLHGQEIAPIPGDYATTGELIRAVTVSELKALPVSELNLADVPLLSPVTRNQQFVCQGANYRQHMIESGMNPDAKNYNMIFTKAQSCICPADSDVIKPSIVKFLDYEIELGLIMRREISGKVSVTEQNLHEFIAGLSSSTTTRRATSRSRRCSSTRARVSALSARLVRGCVCWSRPTCPT